MSDARPNLLLITTDQQRGDHLGIEGHPVLQTPNLDALGRAGTQFRRAYAECPSCIPARRTLLSGQSPEAHGMVGYRDGVQWNPAHTLPGELKKAGYQTQLVGKLHLFPHRKRYGFDHLHWADATHGWGGKTNDYLDWLHDAGAVPMEGGYGYAGTTHGVSANGWVGRPHILAEEHTHTYWCVSQAIDFLLRRDPTSPFFLYVSFIDPHPPLTPPRFYYDRYANLPTSKPIVGDWAEDMKGPQRGLNVDASIVSLDEKTMHFCRAAYCGMINHVDDQLGRLFNFLKDRGEWRDTLILFTSDHGEMLGDHNLYRKTYAYEASARVPMLAQAPAKWAAPERTVIDSPVGLQDVMPTMLDAVGVAVPEACTGRSLVPIIRGETRAVRDVLHGEHSPCYRMQDGNEFLTDGRWKYIWFTQTGREQLFDLQGDPNETHDIALEKDAEQRLRPWRDRMIAKLKDRPEGFTDGAKLIAGRPHAPMMPGR